MTKEQLLKSNTLLLQKLFTVEAQKAATDQDEALMNGIKEVLDSRTIISGKTFKVVDSGLSEKAQMLVDYLTPEDVQLYNDERERKGNELGYDFQPIDLGYYINKTFTLQGLGSVGSLVGKAKKDMRIREKLTSKLRFDAQASKPDAFDAKTCVIKRLIIEKDNKQMTTAKFSFVGGEAKELPFNCISIEVDGSSQIFIQVARENGDGFYQELRTLSEITDNKANGLETI